MSLMRPARLDGLEPFAHLKDLLERLPTHPSSAIKQLLPYRWPPLRDSGYVGTKFDTVETVVDTAVSGRLSR